jgi:hypothetical protein
MIHYKKEDAPYAACGATGYKIYLTKEAKEVECKMCKKIVDKGITETMLKKLNRIDTQNKKKAKRK